MVVVELHKLPVDVVVGKKVVEDVELVGVGVKEELGVWDAERNKVYRVRCRMPGPQFGAGVNGAR